MHPGGCWLGDAVPCAHRNIMARTGHQISENVGESQSPMLKDSLMSHRRRGRFLSLGLLGVLHLREPADMRQISSRLTEAGTGGHDSAAVLRVRAEIIGSHTYGIGGRSQPVLIMISPSISTRTRTGSQWVQSPRHGDPIANPKQPNRRGTAAHHAALEELAPLPTHTTPP
jgi:hypothetical protein